MMRAIRDNETAAAALGKDIAFRRLEAFVFGACLMGLGGALLAHFNRSITPEAIDPMIATFLIWIMRSEEHTSELQSLMRISYAVFCLKKKNQQTSHIQQQDNNSETHNKPNKHYKKLN